MATDRQELNSHYIKVFIPNIIWSLVCLFIGIVGNSCILLVYKLKMKTYGEQRYFIPILAFFYWCATLFAIVYSMLDYTHYVDYESEILCKITVFLTYTWTAISGHTLLVIAVQRYLKICKPFGTQMTLYWRRVAVAITIAYSAAFSSPLLYPSGIRQFQWNFKEHNVTIRTCALNARNMQSFDDIYFSLSSFVIIANILAIVGVYIPIGHVIFKSFRFNRGQTKQEDTSSNGVTAETNLSSDNDNKNSVESERSALSAPDKIKDDTYTKEQVIARTSKQINTKIAEANLTTIRKGKSTDKTNDVTGRKDQVKVNFNLMFFTVIVFYLLSYIPVIAIIVVKSNEVAYWHSLSDVQVSLQLCLLRFYVINNIVNPFIYGYFDFKFRSSVKALLKCDS